MAKTLNIPLKLFRYHTEKNEVILLRFTSKRLSSNAFRKTDINLP